MNFLLTHDQRAMIGTVREVSQDLLKPNWMKYMDGTFPWDNMRALAKIGVLGMAVPEEYGGLGLPVLDTAIVLEEIAKGCYVTAMAVMGEVGVQCKILDNFAPERIVEAVRVRDAAFPQGGGPELEASGGVTLANVRAYAETGVERISVGALTHSAPALDVSMKILPA